MHLALSFFVPQLNLYLSIPCFFPAWPFNCSFWLCSCETLNYLPSSSWMPAGEEWATGGRTILFHDHSGQASPYMHLGNTGGEEESLASGEAMSWIDYSCISLAALRTSSKLHCCDPRKGYRENKNCERENCLLFLFLGYASRPQRYFSTLVFIFHPTICIMGRKIPFYCWWPLVSCHKDDGFYFVFPTQLHHPDSKCLSLI